MPPALPIHLPTAPRGVIELDQNGNQIGTLSNPLFVETTGVGTQPVEIVGEMGYASIASTGQVSILATATQIVPANLSRGGIIVTNPSSSVTVYIGGASVSAASGQELLPGNSLSLPVTCAVYGIVASSTQTVSWIEVQ